MEEIVTKHLRYSVIVEMAWCARCVSPIGGREIVEYRNTVEDARQAVDLALLKEADELGLSIGRWNPESDPQP